MAIPSNVWLKMSDKAITQVELKVDAFDVEQAKDARITQLRKQRRRAMRRALSMEGVIRRLLSAAKGTNAEELEGILRDANLLVNVPLHEALKDMDPQDR